MKCCGLIWGIMAGLAFSACLGPRSASTATGGEVTGVGGTAYSEPTPYGMVFVKKGSLKIGTEETDSLWGMTIPTREISVDGFWMDANEGSNANLSFGCATRLSANAWPIRHTRATRPTR